jgi:hypothetical protein
MLSPWHSPLLPDIEQQLVVFLAAARTPSLTPLHGGRVGTELQSDLACLQVTALGGPQPWPWEAVPEFQISSWGGTKAEASPSTAPCVPPIYDLHGGRHRRPGDRRRHPTRRPLVAGRRHRAPRVRTDIALTVMP